MGDHSADLAETPVGARAYVDGPYGTFSVDRLADAEGFIMMAGGIGITPILSNVRALEARGDPQQVILPYGKPTWDDVSFRDELEKLRERPCLPIKTATDPDGQGASFLPVSRDASRAHCLK